MHAEEYSVCQTRRRVFLRGLRASLLGRDGLLPEPLPPFGRKPLRSFLSTALPCVNRQSLTQCMIANLKAAERDIREMFEDKKTLQEGDLVIFPLDRADGKQYERKYTKNACPTLTVGNTYLFIASAADMAKPDREREYFRFLHPSEGMLLQGFPADTLESESYALRVKGAGNAYPAPWPPSHACMVLLFVLFHGCVFCHMWSFKSDAHRKPCLWRRAACDPDRYLC